MTTHRSTSQILQQDLYPHFVAEFTALNGRCDSESEQVENAARKTAQAHASSLVIQWLYADRTALRAVQEIVGNAGLGITPNASPEVIVGAGNRNPEILSAIICKVREQMRSHITFLYNKMKSAAAQPAAGRTRAAHRLRVA